MNVRTENAQSMRMRPQAKPARRHSNAGRRGRPRGPELRTRPQQPATPLRQSRMLEVAFSQPTNQAALLVESTRRVRRSSVGGGVGWRLTDRAVAVLVIGFLMAMALGLATVVGAYLSV